MAINVDVKVNEDAINDGEFKVKDFAFVGFNILDERNDSLDGVEFFFYLSDDKDDTYLIKNSFIFGDNRDMDLEFLNSPIHDTINLNKQAKSNEERLSELLLDIADDKQYYSSFKAISVGKDCDDIKCIGVHTDKDSKQHKIEFSLPFNVYCRIHILKNQMLYNIPINVFIDQDPAYSKVNLHQNCNLSYIGCDTSYSTQILTFYSLSDILGRKMGLISPIKALNDRILTSNILDKEKFVTMYQNKMAIVNMTKIFIVDWVDGKEFVKRVCVYLREENKVDIFMLGNAEDCILMKPYDMVYGKDNNKD